MSCPFQCRQFNLRRRTATSSEAATQPLTQGEDEESQDILTFTQTDPDTYVASIGGWMADEEGSSSQDGEEQPEIYSQPDLYPPLEEPEIYPQPGAEAAKTETGALQFQDFEVRGQELHRSGVFTQGEEKENIPPGQGMDSQDSTQNPDTGGPGPDLLSLARDWDTGAAMRASIAATPDNPPLRRPRHYIQVHGNSVQISQMTWFLKAGVKVYRPGALLDRTTEEGEDISLQVKTPNLMELQ